MIAVPPSLSRMYHLRNWTIFDADKLDAAVAGDKANKRKIKISNLSNKNTTTFAQIIGAKVLDKIEKSFADLLKNNKQFHRLPMRSRGYHEKFIECYNGMCRTYSHLYGFSPLLLLFLIRITLEKPL